MPFRRQEGSATVPAELGEHMLLGERVGAGVCPSLNAQALTPSLYSRSQRCEKASFRTRCFADHSNLMRFTSRGLASANCRESRTPYRPRDAQPRLPRNKAPLQKLPRQALPYGLGHTGQLEDDVSSHTGRRYCAGWWAWYSAMPEPDKAKGRGGALLSGDQRGGAP